MEIVSIKQEYTDYLHNYDNRVSKNIDKTYVRPYLGVLLVVKNLKYFAPLTSSGKGKKLAVAPKSESITFYPIDNCKLGGINLNNMIPLVDGVYKKYTEIKTLNSVQKNFHEKQLRFLRKNQSHIKKKAIKIYRLKVAGKLYPNYDAVTCDFLKLEKAAMAYSDNVKTSLQPNPLIEKYKLTDEQFIAAEQLAIKDKQDLEKIIRKNIAFAPDGEFDAGVKTQILAEQAKERAEQQKQPRPNTQEKIIAKLEPKKKPQNSK